MLWGPTELVLAGYTERLQVHMVTVFILHCDLPIAREKRLTSSSFRPVSAPSIITEGLISGMRPGSSGVHAKSELLEHYLPTMIIGARTSVWQIVKARNETLSHARPPRGFSCAKRYARGDFVVRR